MMLRLAYLTLSCLVSVVFSSINLDIQAIFTDNSFCGLPIRKGVMNPLLRTTLIVTNPKFRDMLYNIISNDAVLDSFLCTTLKENSRILAAFLNYPDSMLCRALTEDAASPFSCLKAALLEGCKPQAEINSKPKIAKFLSQFFNDDKMIQQIAQAFEKHSELSDFPFPTSWNSWGIFNIFQLNEVRKQPASPHTLVRTVVELLPQYAILYSSFMRNVPNATPQFFLRFLRLLSKYTILENELWRRLLIKKNSRFAQLALQRFDKLVEEPNPATFAATLLGHFFEPACINEIIDVAREFNTVEMLDRALISLDGLVYEETSFWKQNCPDDYLLKIMLLETFCWQPFLVPVSMIKILATLSSYDVGSLGLLATVAINVKFNSIMAIFKNLFHGMDKNGSEMAFSFYIKVSVILVFVADGCPKFNVEGATLTEQVHALLDYLMEPFRLRNINAIAKEFLKRFIALRSAAPVVFSQSTTLKLANGFSLQGPIKMIQLDYFTDFLLRQTKQRTK